MTFLIFLLLIFNPACDEMPALREAFFKINSEEALNNFFKTIDKSNCAQSKAYACVAEMMKAQYVFSPYSKYKHFANGRDALESFIKKYPNNVEARFLRFVVQRKTPKIVGYKNEMENDAAFIRKNIAKSDLPAFYQEKILDSIKEMEHKPVYK